MRACITNIDHSPPETSSISHDQAVDENWDEHPPTHPHLKTNKVYSQRSEASLVVPIYLMKTVNVPPKNSVGTFYHLNYNLKIIL